MSDKPDWLDAAQDRLKDVGLDDAADWLATHLALVEFAEDEIRSRWDESTRRSSVSAVTHRIYGPLLAIVAKARGETPDQAFERLAPTWHMPEPEPATIAIRISNSWAPDFGLDPLDDLRAMWEPASNEHAMPRNRWAAAIAMGPIFERARERQRQSVEDFLRENNADPAIHEHVIYPAPPSPSDRFDLRAPDRISPSRATHLHALIPLADIEGRNTRPTRDQVMAPGSPWPWRLI